MFTITAPKERAMFCWVMDGDPEMAMLENVKTWRENMVEIGYYARV